MEALKDYGAISALAGVILGAFGGVIFWYVKKRAALEAAEQFEALLDLAFEYGDKEWDEIIFKAAVKIEKMIPDELHEKNPTIQEYAKRITGRIKLLRGKEKFLAQFITALLRSIDKRAKKILKEIHSGKRKT